MKRNEQIIVGALIVIAVFAAFWFLVLSPKRNQASQLDDEVSQLKSSLAQAQQDIAAGQQAQKSFRADYRRMVALGKAVPADGEQTSLLVQLQRLADRSGVEFQTVDLGDASASASSAAPAPASTSATGSSSTSTAGSTSSTTSTETSSSDSSATSSTTSAAAPAPASEAAASTLPIGAAVGPAGLPVMPYDMTFSGDFFQIADFMKRLDALVHVRKGRADVRGRLITVDGFSLAPAGVGSPANPELTADLSVTTFLTPADQGLTAGATPAGPATDTPAPTSTATTAGSTATTTSATP